MFLVLDNYDSFTYNLVYYIESLGIKTTVIFNDSHSIKEIDKLLPKAILISPGPCSPKESGISCDLVLYANKNNIPLFGVCLGLQAIVLSLGGEILLSPEVKHGKPSLIHHKKDGLFHNIPTPFSSIRYHSLISSSFLPKKLLKTAWTEDNLIMGIQHQSLPIYGVQFHPESCLTEYGYRILANFLILAGYNKDSILEKLTKIES